MSGLDAAQVAGQEDCFRPICETVPELVVVSCGGRIAYLNRPARIVFGLEKGDLLERRLDSLFLAEDRAMAIAGIEAAAARQGVPATMAFDVRAVDAGGRVLEVEVAARAMTWEGTPAQLLSLRVATERRARERELAERAALVDVLSDAVIVSEGSVANEVVVVSWSRGAERTYGWSAEEVIGRPAGVVLGYDIGPDDPWWLRLVADGAGSCERVHRTKDGRQLPVHVSATALRDETGRTTGFISVISDISERREAEAARQRLEQRYSAVVASLEEGILVFDPEGRVTSANEAATAIFGLDPVGSDLVEGPWRAVDERGRSFAARRWPHRVCLATGSDVTHVVLGLRRGAATTWIRMNARSIEACTGCGRSVVCSVSDITEAKLAQDHLAWAAAHDSLTELANRSGVADYLERLGESGVANLAVLFIDLDRFKMVNDSLGHVAGDALLRDVARRLSDAVRGVTDIVGRLAGDEFVAICTDLPSVEVARAIAGRLLEGFDEPFEVTDAHGTRRSVTVGASIGIAFVEPGENAAEALVDADVAMYVAKERGRGRIEVFDGSLREAARQRLAIREDLRAALAKEELSVSYQPILTPDGAVKGYEALARWTHPERGVIPPATFIPVAEESGLVVPLGAWVLREAALAAAGWRASGLAAYVSVNLSAHQIGDPELVPLVARVLAQTGLPASALVLEITESAVMRDPVLARAVFSELKQLGVQLSIDDFGTGYSSLSYLEQFPVDVLKIDRGFVSPLSAGSQPKLVAGIISLAHLLDLFVVAEGVETEEQAELLTTLGVDALQGYLFGRPGPSPA